MTENDTVRAISEWPVNGLTGRRKIYTAKKKVTPENVVEVLGKALAVHRINRAETVYLYDFYKGKQDIRLKDKIVRPEINNKVMINRVSDRIEGRNVQRTGIGDCKTSQQRQCENTNAMEFGRKCRIFKRKTVDAS